jgi:hypothetical protein
MSALYEALISLSPVRDDELLEGYQRYVSLLETILTREQLDIYAGFIRRTGEIRIFEEMAVEELIALTPEERAIADAVRGNENITMENRRVVALLNQRGEHEVAPDLGAVAERY